MCLHTLSRRLREKEEMRIDSEQYLELVRATFQDLCPYCRRSINAESDSVVEHLDGMNRLRAGLHVSGNVLIACKQCNNEKRRDDSLKDLILADSGWESFLSHDGTRCSEKCKTCLYWTRIWTDNDYKMESLAANRRRISEFRAAYLSPSARDLRRLIAPALKSMYEKCQNFAEQSIVEFVEQMTSYSNANSPPANL